MPHQSFITIKNLKTGPSREWGPNGSFTCTVYFNGVRTAEFFEAGDGGEPEWSRIFNDRAFNNMCQQLGDELNMEVAKAADHFEHTKRMKRLCKNKTLFKVKGDPADEWRTLNGPWGADAKAYLDNKYGDQVETIANEVYA